MTPDRPDPYEFEERAAILEYDAGFSRAEAERRARQMIETPRLPSEPTLRSRDHHRGA
jgi:hypothetical protein